MAPRARRAASAEEHKHDSDDEASWARRKSWTKYLPTLRDDNYEALKVCVKDTADAAGKA